MVVIEVVLRKFVCVLCVGFFVFFLLGGLMYEVGWLNWLLIVCGVYE